MLPVCNRRYVRTVCHDVYDVVLLHFPYVVHNYFIVEFMQRVSLSLNHPCWNYQDGW